MLVIERDRGAFDRWATSAVRYPDKNWMTTGRSSWAPTDRPHTCLVDPDFMWPIEPCRQLGSR
jgi:hypothetical protein